VLRIMSVAGLVALSTVVAGAAAPATGPHTGRGPGGRALNVNSNPGEQNEAFLSRMRIAQAEQAYAATRRAADEMVRIAIEVSERIGDEGTLGPADAKALERLRKIAKRVRGALGGSGDPELAEPPRSARDAAAALGERAKTFRDEIEKSSRYEVSSRLVTLAGDVMLLSETLRVLGGP
jgi:D-serine deaminase-like pyridoxal phosphate-dependent protein